VNSSGLSGLIAMETVVLNGARNGDSKVDEVSKAITLEVGNLGQVSVFELQETSIADCASCFGCYLKTPGECVIDDAARDIAKKLAKADLKVFLTPIVFGGYSSELKKAVDRQLGLLLPLATKI
jgi:multimeric flavodoxin WrbA